MPRLHYVRRARKKNPVADVGESYYWWKFRFGGKRYSKERPKRSQLTQSGFLASLWDLEDNLPSEIDEERAQELIQELENLSSECENSLYNMPDHLQESSMAGMMLQERIDGIEDWTSQIYDIDWSSVTPEEAAEIISDANPGLG
jgi:hypothetical protein